MTSKEFKNQAWKSTTTVKVADWDKPLRVCVVDFDENSIVAEDGNVYKHDFITIATEETSEVLKEPDDPMRGWH